MKQETKEKLGILQEEIDKMKEFDRGIMKQDGSKPEPLHSHIVEAAEWAVAEIKKVVK